MSQQQPVQDHTKTSDQEQQEDRTADVRTRVSEDFKATDDNCVHCEVPMNYPCNAQLAEPAANSSTTEGRCFAPVARMALTEAPKPRGVSLASGFDEQLDSIAEYTGMSREECVETLVAKHYFTLRAAGTI